MRSKTTATLVVVLALGLAACFGPKPTASIRSDAGDIDGVTPDYAAYLNSRDAADERKAKEDEQYATAMAAAFGACAGDVRCVEHLASMVSLVQVADGGSGSGNGDSLRPPAPLPPSRAYTTVERALGVGASIFLGDRATDALETLYGTFGGIVDTVASRPTIQVGGDYVSGTQHVGDAYSAGNDIVQGDGNATSGGHLGDETTITGPYADGDGNVFGDGNRIDSDDTDDHSGGDCDAMDEAAGADCSGGGG